ncbi:MAG TPA: efflux RND transporter periplasmic adaptor subunit [Candidatus Acidoferrum sp.]|jgi:RND family efflux transporter MFP subunit|nr:efflux RND transporter periplasmic adaptor subunit [Candidatus Acidoferrum sp.]
MATTPKSLKPDVGSLRISDTKRNATRSSRRWLWLILGVLALILLAAAASAFRDRKAEVEVAAARKPVNGPAGVLNASGYITPRRRATIAAKITGRVTSVMFDEGTRVTEGQLLATLDDSDVRRALDSAKADRDSAQAAIADYEVQLHNAEIELHRAQQLVKEGVQTQQALDAATMTADSLRAKINLAKQQVAASEARIREQQQAVDNCTIRAPYAGIVVSKDAQVGEMVSPVSAGGGFTRTGIATIVDLHSNEIEVDVSESYIAKVQPNQPVTAILDAYPDWNIPAKVRTVIPTADRQKATVKVRISFTDDNHVRLIDPATQPRILPDMGVKVTFLEDEKPKAAADKSAAAVPVVALVPQVAIHQDNSSKFVFVVKGDTLERRAVSLGSARGTDVEILAGLQPDAVVVVKGPGSLRDGQSVQIKPQ